MMKFVSIHSDLEIQSDILRFRLQRGSNPRTREFVALRNELEVGLIILEDWGPPFIFIYEIFVLPEARNDRVGTSLLLQAEMMAADLGRSSIRVNPKSLCEDAMSNLELRAWYKRKGYIECSSEAGQMEKFLLP